jgi:hypothetical protein
LYKDNKGSIYLKRKVRILRRDSPHKDENVIRYFDYVGYKNPNLNGDTAFELKKVVDVKSFRQVNKSDTFIDFNHVYLFEDRPASFPSIWIIR